LAFLKRAPHSPDISEKAAAMLTLLIIILLIALVGGGLGHSRFGYVGWSPAGILAVILVVWLLSGYRV
jgi:hypothetical protein